MCVTAPSGPSIFCTHRSVVSQWLQNCSPPMVQTNREPMASAQKTFRVSLRINEVPQIHDPKQTVGNSHFLRHIAALWFCLCPDGLGIYAVFAPVQYSVSGCAQEKVLFTLLAHLVNRRYQNALFADIAVSKFFTYCNNFCSESAGPIPNQFLYF